MDNIDKSLETININYYINMFLSILASLIL